MAASTLCLAGDLGGAIGDLAAVAARREEEGDCLPKGGGGGRGAVWREMCRGDCGAECFCEPLLLDRTRHAVAATPEEVEEELEWTVREGEVVIIAPHGGRCRWCCCGSSEFPGRRDGGMCAYLWSRGDGALVKG